MVLDKGREVLRMRNKFLTNKTVIDTGLFFSVMDAIVRLTDNTITELDAIQAIEKDIQEFKETGGYNKLACNLCETALKATKKGACKELETFWALCERIDRLVDKGEKLQADKLERWACPTTFSIF